VPALWAGSTHQRFAASTVGAPLDIDGVLAAHPPQVKPHQDRHVTEIPQPERPQAVSKLAGIQAALVGAADWRDVSDLDRSPFVTESMQTDYLSAPRGSGRFFRFLTQVASRALFRGYAITAPELEALALAMDLRASPVKRQGTRREAERALAFAASATNTDTARDRRHARLRRLRGEA
jgi:hypothetical protein